MVSTPKCNNPNHIENKQSQECKSSNARKIPQGEPRRIRNRRCLRKVGQVILMKKSTPQYRKTRPNSICRKNVIARKHVPAKNQKHQLQVSLSLCLRAKAKLPQLKQIKKFCLMNLQYKSKPSNKQIERFAFSGLQKHTSESRALRSTKSVRISLTKLLKPTTRPRAHHNFHTDKLVRSALSSLPSLPKKLPEFPSQAFPNL